MQGASKYAKKYYRRECRFFMYEKISPLVLVNQSSQNGARQRSGPINVLISPRIVFRQSAAAITKIVYRSGDRRTKTSSRIHTGAADLSPTCFFLFLISLTIGDQFFFVSSYPAKISTTIIKPTANAPKIFFPSEPTNEHKTVCTKKYVRINSHAIAFKKNATAHVYICRLREKKSKMHLADGYFLRMS